MKKLEANIRLRITRDEHKIIVIAAEKAVQSMNQYIRKAAIKRAQREGVTYEMVGLGKKVQGSDDDENSSD